MKLKFLFAIIGVTALTAASFGQGFRGGGMMMGGATAGPGSILRRDDVKADLKLTDDQKAKLAELQDAIRPQFGDIFQTMRDDPAAMQKAMATLIKKASEDALKVLTADQQKRAKEIWIQLSGNGVVANPDIQKDLGIDDSQKAKIDELTKRQQTANQEVGAKLRSGDIAMEDAQGIFAKNTKVMNDEIEKVLTSAQKDKLKGMAGKTFVQDPPPGGGGRSF